MSRTERRYRWILRPTLGQVLPLKGSHNNTLFVPALSMFVWIHISCIVEHKYKCEKISQMRAELLCGRGRHTLPVMYGQYLNGLPYLNENVSCCTNNPSMEMQIDRNSVK